MQAFPSATGKTKKHFYNGYSQNQFSSHAAGATFDGRGATLTEILHNVATDGKVSIIDTIDGFQFISLGIIDFSRHQRHLFLSLLAYFIVGPFLYFVVILDVWRLLIYYLWQGKATKKYAFCMYSGWLYPQMDTIKF